MATDRSPLRDYQPEEIGNNRWKTLVTFLIILIIFIYLSFAAAYAMAPHLGYPAAFLIVAAFYILVFLLIL